MAYQYDVFFSYKHSEEWKPWVFDIFLPAVKDALRVELDREITVFVDVTDMDQFELNNDKLVRELGLRLGYSRCMLAVWSRLYFGSVWCWNECRSFLRRSNDGSPRSPILPVVIHNGAHFPDFAQAIKWLDMREFAIPNMRRDSPKHSGLLHSVRGGAMHLADAIRRAPEWSPHWISEHWLTEEPAPQTGTVPRLLNGG